MCGGVGNRVVVFGDVVSGPACSICSHSERATIEYALRAGEQLRVLAERYKSSAPTLSRHRVNHMSSKRTDLASVRRQMGAVAPSVVDTGDALLDRAAMRVAILTQVMDNELAASRITSALKASQEIRQWSEHEAKLTGRLKDAGAGSTVDARRQIIQIFSSKSESELRALMADGASDVIEGEVLEG